jgi:hypothetical protein
LNFVRSLARTPKGKRKAGELSEDYVLGWVIRQLADGSPGKIKRRVENITETIH